MATVDLHALAEEDFCYLTTTGRVTGRPHEIEIWFAMDNGALYMLSGGRDHSDWVKNLVRTPVVTVRVADQTFEGRAVSSWNRGKTRWHGGSLSRSTSGGRAASRTGAAPPCRWR